MKTSDHIRLKPFMKIISMLWIISLIYTQSIRITKRQKSTTLKLLIKVISELWIISLIYIALRKDIDYPHLDPAATSYCNTTNFNYTEEQAKNVQELGKHLIVKNKDVIIDLIKQITHKEKNEAHNFIYTAYHKFFN